MNLVIRKHAHLQIKSMKQQSPFSRYYKTILKDSEQYKQNQQQTDTQPYYKAAHQNSLKSNWDREDHRVDRETFEKKNSKIKVFGMNFTKIIKQDSSPLLILEEEQQKKLEQNISSDPILLDSTELMNNNQAEMNSFDQRMHDEDNGTHQQLRRLLENSSSMINLNLDHDKQKELININNCEPQQKTLQQVQQIYYLSQVLNQSQLMASEENKGIKSIINTLQQLENPSNNTKRQEQKNNSNLQTYINKPCLQKQQTSKCNIQNEQNKDLKQFMVGKICDKLQKKDESIQTSIVMNQQNENKKSIQSEKGTPQHKQKIGNQICSHNFLKMQESKSTQSIAHIQKSKNHNRIINDYRIAQDNYENKISNLINRYQRASQLKNKDYQIKKQFNIYTHREKQSIEEKQLSYQSQNLTKLRQNKQINQPNVINDNKFVNNYQQQLAQKIVIMDNMINRFKQISEKMSTDNDLQDNGIQQRSKGKMSANNFYNCNRQNLQNQTVVNLQKDSFNNNIQERKKHKLEYKQQSQSIKFIKRDYNNKAKRQNKQQKLSQLQHRQATSLTNKNSSIQSKKHLELQVSNTNYTLHKNKEQNPLHSCHKEQQNQQKNTINSKIGRHKQGKVHLNSIKSHDNIQTSKYKKNIQINQNTSNEQYYEKTNLLIPQQQCENKQYERVKFAKNILPQRQNKIQSKNKSQHKKISMYRSENKEVFKNEKMIKVINQFSNQTIIKNLNQASIVNQYQKLKIDLPQFYKYPQKTTAQSKLLSIGETMFRNLYNFVAMRRLTQFQRLNSKLHFKIQKTNDYIRYFTKNRLNYHLVYYFKQKIYFGEWMDLPKEDFGLKHGFGYYHNLNKYKYEGQFYFDCKHGKGTIQYSNGAIYHGKWMNRKKQGYGILINLSGQCFEGNFIEGKKNTFGQEYLKNGDYYKGQYQMGKFKGIGIYKWANGSIYYGQFNNSLLHGKGVWKSPQNDSYEGQYQYNKKHGYGIYKWNNGTIFQGFFANDEKVIKNSKQISSISKQNTSRTLLLSKNSKEKVFQKCKSPKDKLKFKTTY